MNNGNGKKSTLRDKSYAFALRTIKLSQYVNEKKNAYVLSKQVLRSGTAIGALVRESEYAESRLDFAHKLAIALKEANETHYWLMLLRDSGYITDTESKTIIDECNELIRILISSIKTTKSQKKQ